MAQVSEEREDRVEATGEEPAAAPGTPGPADAGIPAAPEFPGTGPAAETPGVPVTPGTGSAAETPVVPETSGAASVPSGTGEASRLSAAGTAAAETPVGTPAPEAKKGSKAGRNLPAAIGVGLLLGAAIIVSLLTVRFLFIGIIAIAIAVGTFEFAGVLRRVADTRVAMIPVLVGGQTMIWLAWPFGREGALTAFVLTVLACLLWRLPGGAKGYLRDISSSVFAAAYLPLFGAFAAMLVPPSDGVGRVLTFLIGVVASDTGGYIAGVLGGKHPMAPTISPKKTWEGFGGSLVGGVVAGALTLSLLLDGHVWQGVLFGVAIVLTATLGDLVESLIKRDLGVKDMGTLLPGHGGIMDRLDSLLPSAVVSWLLLSAFVPLG
ncbi:phosphatidate cytidylyltransferase [Amycolatopsis sp. NPDC051371]|uniref:phosphatidate cytidylyltransferase n=1 Tax=Amycolatopsis sp. NPDC051371 TaxID=3155800 RepID=UPI00342E2924